MSKLEDLLAERAKLNASLEADPFRGARSKDYAHRDYLDSKIKSERIKEKERENLG